MSQSDSPSLSETAAIAPEPIAYAVMRDGLCVRTAESQYAAEQWVKAFSAKWPGLRVEPLYLRSSLSGSSPEPQGTTDELQRTAKERDEALDGQRTLTEATLKLMDKGKADRTQRDAALAQLRSELERVRGELEAMRSLPGDGRQAILDRAALDRVLTFAREECYSDETVVVDAARRYVDGLIAALRSSGSSLTEASDSGTTKSAPSETPNG